MIEQPPSSTIEPEPFDAADWLRETVDLYGKDWTQWRKGRTIAAAEEIESLRSKLDALRKETDDELSEAARHQHQTENLVRTLQSRLDALRKEIARKPCPHPNWLPFKAEDREYCAMCGEERERVVENQRLNCWHGKSLHDPCVECGRILGRV